MALRAPGLTWVSCGAALARASPGPRLIRGQVLACRMPAVKAAAGCQPAWPVTRVRRSGLTGRCRLTACPTELPLRATKRRSKPASAPGFQRCCCDPGGVVESDEKWGIGGDESQWHLISAAAADRSAGDWRCCDRNGASSGMREMSGSVRAAPPGGRQRERVSVYQSAFCAACCGKRTK